MTSIVNTTAFSASNLTDTDNLKVNKCDFKCQMWILAIYVVLVSFYFFSCYRRKKTCIRYVENVSCGHCYFAICFVSWFCCPEWGGLPGCCNEDHVHNDIESGGNSNVGSTVEMTPRSIT